MKQTLEIIKYALDAAVLSIGAVLLMTYLHSKKRRSGTFFDAIILAEPGYPDKVKEACDAYIRNWGLHRCPTNRATLRISVLTGLRFTTSDEVWLPWWYRISGNPTKGISARHSRINDFHKAALEMAARYSKSFGIPKQDAAKDCVWAICAELNVFNKADKKELRVYSSLAVTSPEFASGDPEEIRLLIKSPSSIAARFSAAYNVQNLKEVTVSFHYEPDGPQDLARYTAMVQAYRLWLEPLGATIICELINPRDCEVARTTK